MECCQHFYLQKRSIHHPCQELSIVLFHPHVYTIKLISLPQVKDEEMGDEKVELNFPSSYPWNPGEPEYWCQACLIPKITFLLWVNFPSLFIHFSIAPFSLQLKLQLLSKASKVLHKPLNHFVSWDPFCFFPSTLCFSYFRQLSLPIHFHASCPETLSSAHGGPAGSSGLSSNATVESFLRPRPHQNHTHFEDLILLHLPDIMMTCLNVSAPDWESTCWGQWLWLLFIFVEIIQWLFCSIKMNSCSL